MKYFIKSLCLILSIVMMCSLFGCSNGEEWEEYSVFEEVPGEEESVDEGQTLTSSTNKKVVKKKKIKNKDMEDQGLIGSDKLTPQEELFAKHNLKGTKFTYVGSEYMFPQEQYAIDMLKNRWGVESSKVIYSNTALPSMVATLVASGNPPDLGHSADTTIMRYAYTGLATAIDDYLVKDDVVWNDGTAFRAYTFNGKTYGMSWSTDFKDNYFVWYNKSYFKEVGAEDPYELYKAGKWDVEAFKRVAKKCVKYASDGKTVETYGAMCWNPALFLALYGEQAVTEQKNGSWKVTVDSAAGMKGLQLIHDLYASDCIKLQGGYKQFGVRQTAMIIERAPNAIGNYDYYNTMEDEIGWAPLPSTEYGSYGFTNTDGEFVFKGAKNPVAAVAMRYYDCLFINHTSNAEKKAAGYEVNEAVKISDDHKKLAEDYLANVCKKSLDSKLYALSNWTEGERLASAFWSDLTDGGKQPAQLVDSAKAQIKKCLKDTVGAQNVVD